TITFLTFSLSDNIITITNKLHTITNDVKAIEGILSIANLDIKFSKMKTILNTISMVILRAIYFLSVAVLYKCFTACSLGLYEAVNPFILYILLPPDFNFIYVGFHRSIFSLMIFLFSLYTLPYPLDSLFLMF